MPDSSRRGEISVCVYSASPTCYLPAESDDIGSCLAVSQEAIATGDPELAQMVLRERDVQRYSNRATALPALLQRLTEVSHGPAAVSPVLQRSVTAVGHSPTSVSHSPIAVTPFLQRSVSPTEVTRVLQRSVTVLQWLITVLQRS